MALSSGTRLGPIEILELPGAGGMGSVDRGRVVQMRGIQPSRDARAYAYRYLRVLFELYVVDGLK
jgi:hypothetical protein